MEPEVAWGSGLRTKNIRLHCRSVQTHNVNARPIGGTASVSVTAWTALAMNNKSMATLGTLVAQIAQGTPVAGTVALRVKGYNQFHEYVEEVTPVVTLAAKTNNFVYLASTFAYVVSVEFMSTGLDIASDTISLGTRWDWTRTIDGTNEHLFGRNLGIALPLRVSSYQDQLPTTGAFQRTKEAGRTLSVGDLDLAKLPERMQAPARHGFARLEATGVPTNGQTVTIDTKVYTWKTTLTAADGDVLIGSDAQACLLNLSLAMLAQSGAGVSYGANTTAHTTVTPVGSGLVGANQNLFVAAKITGARGNIIAVAEASTNMAWLTSAGAVTTFLRDGFDFPNEVASLVVCDLTGHAAAGAVMIVPATDFTCGWNWPGWQGERAKLHILQQTSVAAWAVADNIMVSMDVLSAEVR